MLNPFKAQVYVEGILEQLDVMGVVLEKKCVDKLKKCIDVEPLVELEKKVISHAYHRPKDEDIKKVVEKYITTHID